MRKLSVIGCLYSVFFIVCIFQSAGQDEKIDEANPSAAPFQSSKQTGIIYRNPRPFNITYSFELIPDPAKIDRAKDLKLWLPIPREWDSQKAVKILSVNPPPHDKYEDPEYGNLLYFWDFGKESERVSYKTEVKIRLEVYEARVEIDPARVGTYDKTSDEYKLYTRSENIICITPEVRELALEAVGDEKNPYLQAERILKFASKKVHYQILDFERGRGVQCLLDYPLKDEKTGDEYYLGCCNQKSAFIIALCRAVGIPARAICGFRGWNPGRQEADLEPLYEFETRLSPAGLAGAQHYGHAVPHVWTEIYIPSYGWVPVDAGAFLPLDNKRVVFSKGRDVRIGPFCPQNDSEGYGSQWVLINDGRADILFSGVWNITRIRDAKVKLLIEPDPFPADSLAEYLENVYPEAKAERELKEWRIMFLGSLDLKTRGRPDKYAALAEIYERGNRGDIVRYCRKGPFVCHMLRKMVGDKRFFQILKEYENLRVSSSEPVSTDRFREIAESIYGNPLDWFFNQWSKETELPEFKLDDVIVTKDYNGWQIRGHLLQVGDAFFRVPMELAIDTENGTESHRIWQDERDVEFEFHTPNEPKRLTLDPNNDIMKIQRMPPSLSMFWDLYPDMVVVYGTVAEVDANRAAAERFDDEYLGLGHEIIKADTDVTEEDLKAKCIVLFGRPATNKIAQQFKEAFPIKFDGDEFTWQGKTYDGLTQGVAQIIDHPLNPRVLLILYAGLSGEATLQVCDSYLYDAVASYIIFDRDEELLSGNWEDTGSGLVWKIEPDGR